MSLAVLGSLGFDSIATPFSAVHGELGGTGAYAALAASLLTETQLVSAVGDDFGRCERELLERHGVDSAEVLQVTGTQSFSWEVSYGADLTRAQSAQRAENVLYHWLPWLGLRARNAEVLLLGPLDPDIQCRAAKQWNGTGVLGVDTNCHWIANKRKPLLELLSAADVVFLNPREARVLTGKPLVLEAAYRVRSMGPKAVVIKLAQYGYAVLHADGYFAVSADRDTQVCDPTGTGSAFAGAMLAYVDRVPEGKLSLELLQQASRYAAAAASVCAEALGPRRLFSLSEFELLHRANEYKADLLLEHAEAVERVALGRRLTAV